jgi:hypothetical protein
MKKYSILSLSLALLAGVLTTSCEDMLTVDTGDKSYGNANDTLYSYLGIMRCMQDVAERQVILGEIRGDLVSPTVYTTDTLYAISNFDKPEDASCSMLQISDYYNIINNCNFYIANADTSAIKSNIKYMIPEYAQVQSIRAWAYLQLVKNYGSVPFITKPVNSLGVVKDFDYNANQATKDNLVDLLLAEGLEKYVDTKYPSYGNWENGSVSISSRLCFIPVRLVLGDLYLLRGASEGDYRTAAKYYYDYLRTTLSAVTPQYVSATRSRVSEDGFSYNKLNGFGEYAKTYVYTPSAVTTNGYNYGNEVISLIPGSANKGFGTMLTRVADIFGYTPTSSQNTSVGETEEGEEEVSTSGAISVRPNYRRQYAPSLAYEGVNEAQTYVHYEVSGVEPLRIDYECGDARFSASVGKVTYEGEAYNLCGKASSGSTFYYTIPIYRKTLVWLRLAEAINRAGYPEFAFAILKDGLNRNNLPVIETRTVKKPVVDPETGEPTLDPETGKEITVSVDERYVKYNAAEALYYVTDTLQLQAFNSFLDFTDDIWNTNFGIHARGCGYGSWAGEYRTTNLTGTRDSVVYAYDKLLLKQGVDLKDANVSKNDIINAVENVIVDELALETAFEGNRFTDLVRIAEHKNAAGYNGTEWLADKIACRGMKVDKNDPTNVKGERDEVLYGKLLDLSNWYLDKPVWDVK